MLVEALERRTNDGKLVGSMEIAAFSAALVIDRDGVLQEVVAAGTEKLLAPPARGRVVSLGPIEYAAAGGFRADLVITHDAGGIPELPHASVISLAPHDFTVSAGLYIVVRSVTSDWEAATAMLESLTFLR